MNEETDNLILVSAEKAARLLDISKRHFLSLESSGQVGPVAVKLGARRLYSVDELRAWAAAKCPTRAVWLDMIQVHPFPWKHGNN